MNYLSLLPCLLAPLAMRYPNVYARETKNILYGAPIAVYWVYV